MSEMCVSKPLDDYGDLLDETEHRWRRRLIGLALLAALIGVGAYALWTMMLSGGGTATAEVQTATVEHRLDLNHRQHHRHRRCPVDDEPLLHPVRKGHGRQRQAWAGGQAGDVLAEIDSTSLQQALTTAQVGLSSSQTRLNQLLEGSTQSELASADQSLVQAQASLR